MHIIVGIGVGRFVNADEQIDLGIGVGIDVGANVSIVLDVSMGICVDLICEGVGFDEHAIDDGYADDDRKYCVDSRILVDESEKRLRVYIRSIL